LEPTLGIWEVSVSKTDHPEYGVSLESSQFPGYYSVPAGEVSKAVPRKVLQVFNPNCKDKKTQKKQSIRENKLYVNNCI